VLGKAGAIGVYWFLMAKRNQRYLCDWYMATAFGFTPCGGMRQKIREFVFC